MSDCGEQGRIVGNDGQSTTEEPPGTGPPRSNSNPLPPPAAAFQSHARPDPPTPMAVPPTRRSNSRPPPRRVDHTYRDYSGYPLSDLPPAKKAPTNFPSKLAQILSTPDFAHVRSGIMSVISVVIFNIYFYGGVQLILFHSLFIPPSTIHCSKIIYWMVRLALPLFSEHYLHIMLYLLSNLSLPLYE